VSSRGLRLASDAFYRGEIARDIALHTIDAIETAAGRLTFTTDAAAKSAAPLLGLLACPPSCITMSRSKIGSISIV
jgi:hypothetical protein